MSGSTNTPELFLRGLSIIPTRWQINKISGSYKHPRILPGGFGNNCHQEILLFPSSQPALCPCHQHKHFPAIPRMLGMKSGIQSWISRSPEGTLKKSCSSLGMKNSISGVIGSRFPAVEQRDGVQDMQKCTAPKKKRGNVVWKNIPRGLEVEMQQFRGSCCQGKQMEQNQWEVRMSQSHKGWQRLQEQQFQPFRSLGIPLLLLVKLQTHCNQSILSFSNHSKFQLLHDFPKARLVVFLQFLKIELLVF